MMLPEVPEGHEAVLEFDPETGKLTKATVRRCVDKQEAPAPEVEPSAPQPAFPPPISFPPLPSVPWSPPGTIPWQIPQVPSAPFGDPFRGPPRVRGPYEVDQPIDSFPSWRRTIITEGEHPTKKFFDDHGTWCSAPQQNGPLDFDFSARTQVVTG